MNWKHIRKSLRRWGSTVFLVSLVALLGWKPASGQSRPEGGEPFQGAVVCLPEGRWKLPEGDCLLAGPAAYQARLRAQGISLPLRPLPAHPIDPALANAPYLYGRVRTANAPVYGSLEDAKKGARKQAVRRMEVGPRGLTYISYQDQALIDGRRFYMVAFGNWMTANDVIRITPAYFRGLEFTATPRHDFGWILETVPARRSPGEESEETGRYLYRYEVVQIYAQEEAEGETWFLIAPDQWIPGSAVGRVMVNPVPPPGVENGRWIEVNLYEQTLSVYEGGRLRFATLVSTGVEPFWTRPGLFQIRVRLETETMRGVFETDRSDYYYLEDVPWTMYFDEDRALHGAYWHNGFGAPRSHGCVNMALADAHWLFDWAQEGDWVYVWDPSGRTPVEPDAYSDGGA